MDINEDQIIVGIDLGTTNSALSYVDLSGKNTASKIKMFHTPQVFAPGELARLPVLPSFLYLPGQYDVDRENLKLPWKDEEIGIVGTFAREQGSKVPGRLVSSAKSWLCHSKVDRTAPILPWNADKEVQKVSPVFASGSYLKHLRIAWNHQAKGVDEKFLENQFVIITVPASFDEVARDFTMEAARTAGIGEVTLLEEPLAAFYSWLVFHENDWENYVKPGELILAVDVGGGTTDFTLITLREVDGSPRFERIAVGDHLILGGDNMDLALARKTEAGFKKAPSQSLNANRWQALCHQCRQAKEAILGGEVDKKTVTLMGEGRGLIANTLSATLTRDQVEETILDGFFPVVDSDSQAPAARKGGITEFGLPYEQDPAVTRHMCKFLERHAQSVKDMLGKEVPFPDLLLFNGGSLKPEVIQTRIREGIKHWFKSDRLPGVLENPDLDLAVARGAAYYGLVKSGMGVKVGSGSARGYYLQVSGAEGQNGKGKALCLLERGVEEGTRINLSQRQFQVLANQPVSFQVYSSSYRSGDKAGDIIDIDDTLTLLPPINTVIQFGKKGVQTQIPVEIEAHYTEVGTLSLWCKSVNTDHKWRLQFQIRKQEAASLVEDGQVFEESIVNEVFARIDEVFGGKKGELPPERLPNVIAEIVELPREKWPLSLVRRIADDLLKKQQTGRAHGADYEARWLNLMGFCLRPGFGDALDEHRMRTLWSFYKKGPVNPKNPQVMLEWWVLWRRAAGGLTAGQQRQVFQDLMPQMKNAKAGKLKIPPQQKLEMWMLLANLERLHIKDKLECAKLLMEELHPKKAKPQQWWSLSRLGSRELLYGPLDRVVYSKDAAAWINTILETEWKNPKPVCQALAHLARMTGDIKRDIEEADRAKVLEWMKNKGAAKSLTKMVAQVVAMDRQEEDSMFGEALPAGIVLRD